MTLLRRLVDQPQPFTLLAPNGAPYCFDDPSTWHADDDLADFCEDCPLGFQAGMVLERRCFPPRPEETAVVKLVGRVEDPLNARALLEQARLNIYPSDRLLKPRYLQ